MATYCNAFKMETDENKFGFAQNPDSFESWQGRRGPYYTPVVSADGTLSWVNNGGLPNPQPVNIAGPPGQGLEIQGVVETVQQLPTGAAQGDVWLVGTDSPYEAYIWVAGGWLDLGQVAVGPQGPAGEPGTDGVSPEVTVTEISGGHRVTITDAGGTEAFDVLDGEDGQPGSPGAAGVSPDVTVTAITGGHRVTITDAGGTQTFDVMDGEDGQPGSPGAAGSDGTTFTPSVSAAGVISWTNDGGKANPDPVNIKGPQGPAGADGAQIYTAALTIPYASWTGSGPYTQTVTITGATITAAIKVDLQADAAALAQLINDGVSALFIVNNAGTLTATAIGAAPTADLTVQVCYYETV
ncbi:MAG: hypothetical protein IJI06_02380 [Oscillospiraceae bacterium]|nr:hypothetical protein [Oscillospiraceae bacterium]